MKRNKKTVWEDSSHQKEADAENMRVFIHDPHTSHQSHGEDFQKQPQNAHSILLKCLLPRYRNALPINQLSTVMA